MSETTTTVRLMAAAKEFNIGKDTLVDFLVSKGFSKDDLKPTSKLTEEMYRSLQSEFQSDKAAKMKSDTVELPKGSQAEAKKKKEDEEILFRKEDKKVVTPKKEEAPVVAPPVVETPVVEEVKPEVKEPEPEPVAEVEAPAKVEAPETPQLKVIDKIDLSAIDSSTRPKKSVKKKEEPVAEPVAEVKAPEVVAPKVEVEEPVAQQEPVVAEPVKEEDAPAVIENIRADKIEGPKILGKIELPVDSDTRPKLDEKRKRKRIPIEKKDVRPGGATGRAPGTGPQITRPN
ncbi:MAG: translation initiation factor IF-2, partial [Chitinophagaceae bacterium]